MKLFEGLNNVDIIKKLSSKRNSVFLLEGKYNNEVIKKFNDKEFYKRELTVHNILQKEYSRKRDNYIYGIPRIISFNDEELYIKYQYIVGDTLLNSFENYEKENNIKAGIRIMKLLFEWIDKFQKTLTIEENIELLSLVNIKLSKDIIDEGIEVISFVDINFKNFIISDEVLYGFDFENVSIDLKINDYLRSLAYMMLYNPVKSDYKREVLLNLLKELKSITNLSTDEIYELYIDEVKKIEKRRFLKITGCKND